MAKWGVFRNNSDNICSILETFLGGGDKVVLLMYTHGHHFLCAVQIVSNFSHLLESLRCRIIVWIWIFHCRADKYLKWFHHSDTVEYGMCHIKKIWTLGAVVTRSINYHWFSTILLGLKDLNLCSSSDKNYRWTL